MSEPTPREIWDSLTPDARQELRLVETAPNGVIYPHPALLVYDLVDMHGAVATLNERGRRVVEAGHETA